MTPLLLISSVNFDNDALGVDKNSFDYDSYCASMFKMGTETSYDGSQLSFLKFRIKNTGITPNNEIEFIISKKKALGAIGPGRYRIIKDKNGFLDFRKGIFGFLNSENYGELPLFADFGEIELVHLDDRTIDGSINVKFKNALGDSVHIRGNFIGQL